MGQFSNPVATHPRINEVEVPPSGGYGYSTIVKARSAISNVVALSMNWSISNDPLVSRLMRGTFSLQRSLPKHPAFWTSSTYFNTFIKLIHKHVPLKTLRIKSRFYALHLSSCTYNFTYKGKAMYIFLLKICKLSLFMTT